MSFLAFALQVLPVSLLAFAATALGALLRLDERLRLPLLLLGVLLYAALMTFRHTPRWNLVILLALAAAAGALLVSVLGSNQGAAWGPGVGLSLGIITLSLSLGRALRGRFRRAGKALWILAWIYLAGWLLLLALEPALWLVTVWAGAGVAIFGGLIVVWYAQLGAMESARSLAVPQGSDLYLLGLNIAVALQMLLTFLGRR
jgi:hypothetical protein